MSEPPRFERFCYWRTFATYRVRVVFNLKGCKPQKHDFDLDVGEQRSDAFLKVDLLGAIPALIERTSDAPVR
jgi:maleylacetoacetate isomerase/maleylpyruvate isomerase